MRKNLTRKQKAVIAVAAGALGVAGSGVAWAYWSVDGDGTGTATTGNTTNDFVLSAVFAAPAYPGAADETVTYKVSNANDEPLWLDNIDVSLATDKVGCEDVVDFSLDDYDDIDVSESIAAGAVDYTVATGTLSFNETASNQNDCKGATVTLTLSSDGSE